MLVYISVWQGDCPKARLIYVSVNFCRVCFRHFLLFRHCFSPQRTPAVYINTYILYIHYTFHMLLNVLFFLMTDRPSLKMPIGD